MLWHERDKRFLSDSCKQQRLHIDANAVSEWLGVSPKDVTDGFRRTSEREQPSRSQKGVL